MISIMTYSRRGTIDVTRFSNDVLDNVVVGDSFRHDEWSYCLNVRDLSLYSGGEKIYIYCQQLLISSWMLRNQSLANHISYRTPNFDMIHTRARHERHKFGHNCIIASLYISGTRSDLNRWRRPRHRRGPEAIR